MNNINNRVADALERLGYKVNRENFTAKPDVIKITNRAAASQSWEGHLLSINGKVYKVLSANNTTLTIILASPFERFKSWFWCTLSRMRWKVFEWYDDILERLNL